MINTQSPSDIAADRADPNAMAACRNTSWIITAGATIAKLIASDRSWAKSPKPKRRTTAGIDAIAEKVVAYPDCDSISTLSFPLTRRRGVPKAPRPRAVHVATADTNSAAMPNSATVLTLARVNSKSALLALENTWSIVEYNAARSSAFGSVLFTPAVGLPIVTPKKRKYPPPNRRQAESHTHAATHRRVHEGR